MEKLLFGRELLSTELSKNILEEVRQKSLDLRINPSFVEERGKIYCGRCQSEMTIVQAHECICNHTCAYCRNCIKMGKVRKCSQFYHLPEENMFKDYQKNILAWDGELSEQQAVGANMIVEAIKAKEKLLVWAVTGAGKTEMLFKGIEYALLHNMRICIATPRIDVCLELAPRIRTAFPATSLAILYGDMDEKYQYTQLVISTTHQLFRFKEAFDVLIIDEVDAFPFYLDHSLQFAADKARKEESSLIYLSATPSNELQKEAEKGELRTVILPARYHGFGLPVPRSERCPNWSKNILQKTVKTSFGKILDEFISKQKRFLIFVPNIEWMLQLEKVLRTLYPNILFESVSAEDPNRKQKIMSMRQEEIQFILTTTILERGVTFPGIDVLVIGAENRIFTESALVQIAGRCGRSSECPMGEVIFFHDGKTLAIKRAIKQIKKMNALAEKQGLLKHQEEKKI